ncbi:hypothetical protein [Yersinia frederiksenii]|uniref:hypothetical protein n=1 Tax=Yersinia frederiksenii TaxID=29484 RepID=UPI0005E530D4|nr:hypothetical protein [Yersinia frederiksenii]CQH45602.1 Uncharacterised protein [Yersinia frederiksenii]
MSIKKQASRLHEKRVNLWLLQTIFCSQLMRDDESDELRVSMVNTHLFRDLCIKYIGKKEINKYLEADDYFDKCRNNIERQMIPFSDLEWIDCERALSFAANFIHADYKLYKQGNNPTLLDVIAPEWSLSKDGSGINYEGLILLIDYQCRVSGVNHIRSGLEQLKVAWGRIYNSFKKPFWFPSDRYENKYFEDYQWILSSFEKNNMISGNVDIFFKKNLNLKVHSIFDQWAERKSNPEIELFLIRLKKAWHQKKFRDSVANKKVLNTYISKECKKELDYLVNKNDMKINEIIENLIHEAYAKTKLKSWEQ